MDMSTLDARAIEDFKDFWANEEDSDATHQYTRNTPRQSQGYSSATPRGCVTNVQGYSIATPRDPAPGYSIATPRDPATGVSEEQQRSNHELVSIGTPRGTPRCAVRWGDIHKKNKPGKPSTQSLNLSSMSTEGDCATQCDIASKAPGEPRMQSLDRQSMSTPGGTQPVSLLTTAMDMQCFLKDVKAMLTRLECKYARLPHEVPCAADPPEQSLVIPGVSPRRLAQILAKPMASTDMDDCPPSDSENRETQLRPPGAFTPRSSHSPPRSQGVPRSRPLQKLNSTVDVCPEGTKDISATCWMPKLNLATPVNTVPEPIVRPQIEGTEVLSDCSSENSDDSSDSSPSSTPRNFAPSRIPQIPKPDVQSMVQDNDDVDLRNSDQDAVSLSGPASDDEHDSLEVGDHCLSIGHTVCAEEIDSAPSCELTPRFHMALAASPRTPRHVGAGAPLSPTTPRNMRLSPLDDQEEDDHFLALGAVPLFPSELLPGAVHGGGIAPPSSPRTPRTNCFVVPLSPETPPEDEEQTDPTDAHCEEDFKKLEVRLDIGSCDGLCTMLPAMALEPIAEESEEEEEDDIYDETSFESKGLDIDDTCIAGPSETEDEVDDNCDEDAIESGRQPQADVEDVDNNYDADAFESNVQPPLKYLVNWGSVGSSSLAESTLGEFTLGESSTETEDKVDDACDEDAIESGDQSRSDMKDVDNYCNEDATESDDQPSSKYIVNWGSVGSSTLGMTAPGDLTFAETIWPPMSHMETEDHAVDNCDEDAIESGYQPRSDMKDVDSSCDEDAFESDVQPPLNYTGSIGFSSVGRSTLGESNLGESTLQESAPGKSIVEESALGEEFTKQSQPEAEVEPEPEVVQSSVHKQPEPEVVWNDCERVYLPEPSRGKLNIQKLEWEAEVVCLSRQVQSLPYGGVKQKQLQEQQQQQRPALQVRRGDGPSKGILRQLGGGVAPQKRAHVLRELQAQRALRKEVSDVTKLPDFPVGKWAVDKPNSIEHETGTSKHATVLTPQEVLASKCAAPMACSPVVTSSARNISHYTDSSAWDFPLSMYEKRERVIMIYENELQLADSELQEMKRLLRERAK